MARKTPTPPEPEMPLRLAWMTPDELSDNPGNWRRHPTEQVSALNAAMETVGWAGAALYNAATGRLVDGHCRKKIRPELLVDGKMPVLIGNWTEEQERMILLTLDPLAGMAEADSAALESLIKDVRIADEALAAMVEGLAEDAGLVLPSEETSDPVDAEPQIDRAAELQEQWGTSQGQLWQINGKDGAVHRLLCGDSANADDVARLMNGERALLMNTDAPYGVALDTRTRMQAAESADGRRRPSLDRADDASTVENDDFDGPALQDFLERCIRAAVPHLIENCAFYLWHPMLTQGTFFAAAAAAAADILIHRQIIWVKPSLLFGFGDYHWRHELCFYGWRRGHRPAFYGERNQTTVWELTNETSPANRLHPTQKPVELFRRPILNHTRQGEIVYEPFAGSGSQFLAANDTGRVCYGLDVEPKFCAVVLQRCLDVGMQPRLAE